MTGRILETSPRTVMTMDMQSMKVNSTSRAADRSQAGRGIKWLARDVSGYVAVATAKSGYVLPNTADVGATVTPSAADAPSFANIRNFATLGHAVERLGRVHDSVAI